ncbi:MAG: hypothetical protein C4523_10860 [Myxococcales bacterium]|nr:MAG: hypothetical protein C4523_10860 [Myxococcales bacterium]
MDADIARMRKGREGNALEKLAAHKRHMETILAAEHVDPDTGEVHTVERAKRAVTLVDIMHRDGLLSMELHRAAEKIRELYFAAQGSSAGVSSYGEYSQATEASQRLPASQRQLLASREYKLALEAVVGVRRKDGRVTEDEQLRELFIRAVIDDSKEVTQVAIGARSSYKNRVQQSAAGGTIIQECLQRLALHFQYRER